MGIFALPLDSDIISENQLIETEFADIKLMIKREDLIHPEVPGNKWRKLKYNLVRAREIGEPTLLTFGGAFSNHIAAVAAAGRLYKFSTIGIIRGEELSDKIDGNPTLKFAAECGMKLVFIPRSQYALKESLDFIENLRSRFGKFYLIPEGGTNALAIRGCEEILTDADRGFEYICTAVGTGGTLSGLVNSAGPNQKVLGFPAIKGIWSKSEFLALADRVDQCELLLDYHFGGYGKTTAELIEFINKFYSDYQIKLDPIYTGKMMFGIFDLIAKGYFKPGSSILAIHTGGIQGVNGMNKQLLKKKQPIIEFL